MFNAKNPVRLILVGIHHDHRENAIKTKKTDESGKLGGEPRVAAALSVGEADALGDC